MPYNEIRAINRSCRSYRPGHQVHWIRAQVHWIRAKKSVEEEQPVIDVTVVVHDDGRVDIQADDLNLTAWNQRSAATAVSGGNTGAAGRCGSRDITR